MINTQCPICHSIQEEPVKALFQIHDTLDNMYDIVICRQCGHVFTYFNRETNIDAYYDDLDYTLQDTRKTLFHYMQEIEYNRVLRHIKKITSPHSKELLDFGCGKGIFLSFAKEKNFSVKGVETSLPRSGYAKKYFNIDIDTRFYTSGQIFPKQFDIVTVFHVAEHLTSPEELLKPLIKDNLKPNGLLVIEAPNFSSWQSKWSGKRWMQLDVPRHISHFRPIVFKKLAEGTGCHIVHQQTFSLHLGIIGMAQTVMSFFGYKGFLMGDLKHKRTPSLLLKVALATPFALLLESIAAMAGKGGVIRYYMKKNHEQKFPTFIITAISLPDNPICRLFTLILPRVHSLSYIMNILILHSSSGLYGSSKILLSFTKVFLEQGHSPVVVLSEEGPLSDELRKTGAEVKIIRLGVIRRKYYSVGGIINRSFISVKAFFALRKLIRRKKIDLVYSNTTAVLIGAVVAKMTSIRHIWHVHEIIETPSFLYKTIGWMLNTMSNKVIVVSNAVKDHWKKVVSENKIILVYNGFDYAEFDHNKTTLKDDLKLDNNTLMIGTIGRIHFWKGQDYFLEIAGILSSKYPFARFIIAGDAYPGYEYLYEEFEAIKEKHQINDVVFDLGFRSDIVNVMNAFDIFVLPSISHDPFPTVVLEAMAASKPVVATDQGGSREMVEEGISGILIPINEPGKAAARMAELIEDRMLRQQMGFQGKERVHKLYSLEAFNEAIINAIK